MKLSDIRKLMNIPVDEVGIPFALIDEGTDTAQIPGAIAVNYDHAKQASFHGTCSAHIAYAASKAPLHCFRYGRKAALRYCAEHGIRLISYSMRSTDFDAEETELIKQHGIIFVAAAGNSGKKGVEYPAKNDLTIAVAAYDGEGRYIESYSSKGPEVDEAAYTDWEVELPRSTVTFDGTSAAAPVIAGCLSIYLKYHPTATVDECRDFLRENSMDIGAPGRDEESGWGLFRFPKSDDWKKEATEMLKNFVILNPGHFYPPDPGSTTNGLRESDIALELVNDIAAGLPAYGINYAIVRSNDLAEICDEADKYDVDALFLSIHVNAGGGTGYEDYCCNATSEANTYRQLLRIEVMNYLSQYKVIDRGQKHKAFAVLAGTKQLGILTENLFIDNAKDAALLADPAFRKGLAAAYVKGIARALGQSLKPQVGPTVPEWAKDGIAWGLEQGLLDTPEGSSDWYRFMTVLKRYDELRFGG
jgi:N-acetylmuramoyl-L-alanine amidase